MSCDNSNSHREQFGKDQWYHNNVLNVPANF